MASVSVHALRHYERLGLIHPDRRANGYRDYPARMRREVVFIAMSRQLGFSLPQIALRLDDAVNVLVNEALRPVLGTATQFPAVPFAQVRCSV